MTSVGRGDGEVLKFVTCLHILLFFKQQIYCSFLRVVVRGWRGGGGVYRRHNSMILNIKACFDKKVTVLALVPVL